MQKVLVTGSNSFIGRHLMPFLFKSGYEIKGIVRNQDSELQQDYTSKFLGYPNLTGDLSDRNFLNTVNWKPDVIIHLAANSGLNSKVSKVINDNVISALNLMEFANNVNCSKIIFTSTISVHGSISQDIVSENTGFMDPDIYGLTKRAAEILIQRNNNIATAFIVRLPAVIGVGASNHWLSRVLLNAIKNNDIEIHNPSSLFNNAVYIYDIVKFLEQLIRRSEIGIFTFPLASTKPIDINTLVHLLIEQCNSQSKVLVSRRINSEFTIDDSYAREKFSYNSLSISSAIKHYVADTLFGK